MVVGFWQIAATWHVPREGEFVSSGQVSHAFHVGI